MVDDDFIFANGSVNQKKFSAHLIIDNLIFKNNIILKKFVEKFEIYMLFQDYIKYKEININRKNDEKAKIFDSIFFINNGQIFEEKINYDKDLNEEISKKSVEVFNTLFDKGVYKKNQFFRTLFSVKGIFSKLRNKEKILKVLIFENEKTNGKRKQIDNNLKIDNIKKSKITDSVFKNIPIEQNNNINVNEIIMFDKTYFLRSLVHNVDLNKIKYYENGEEGIKIIEMWKIMKKEYFLKKKKELFLEIGKILDIDIVVEEDRISNEIFANNNIFTNRNKKQVDNKSYWTKFEDNKLKSYLTKLFENYTNVFLKTLKNTSDINPTIGQLFSDEEHTFLLIHFEVKRSKCEIVRTNDKSIHFVDGKHDDESIIYYTLNLRNLNKAKFYFYQLCRHESCQKIPFGKHRLINDYLSGSELNNMLNYLQELKNKTKNKK